jgi:hypothetical protein
VRSWAYRAMAYLGLVGDYAMRQLPKPDRRQIGYALLLGRSLPPRLLPAAAEFARRIQWWPWVGAVSVALGALNLVVAGLHGAGTGQWLLGSVLLVIGAGWLLIGFNARRVVRADRRSRN